MSRFLIPSSSVAEEDKPISRFLPAKEPKPKDVFEEAETDPAVQSWFKELKSKHPDIPQATASEFMRQPQGMEGYNYEAALKAGVKPKLDPETGELHWGSADPATGQILKGILHKTYGKELAAQQAQDAAKIEEQALGLPKEVEQQQGFDRSMQAIKLNRLAQEAFKANEQANQPLITGSEARRAARAVLPAIFPVPPTVFPETEAPKSGKLAPYAMDTAIVAGLAAHGNVPALISYGAFRAAQLGLDKLPKISETKAGKTAEEVMPETPLAGVGIGGLQAKIPTKAAMDIIQEGAKFWLAMKSGQFASGKYLQGIEAIKKLAPRAAVDTIKGEVIGKISGWMNEQGAAGAAMKSNPLEDPAIQQAVNEYSEFIYAKMMQQGGITPELAKKAQTLLFKRAADKALTSLSNMLPKMGRSTFFSGIPIPEELPKLRDILGAFKLSPEIMAQVEAGQMAALPAEALAAVKQQMPHLFSQAPQYPVSGKTAPPFPEKRQSGEPAAITPQTLNKVVGSYKDRYNQLEKRSYDLIAQMKSEGYKVDVNKGADSLLDTYMITKNGKNVSAEELSSSGKNFISVLNELEEIEGKINRLESGEDLSEVEMGLIRSMDKPQVSDKTVAFKEGGLSQAMPEEGMVRVPAEKKEVIKQLFSLDKLEDINAHIEAQADYQAARQRLAEAMKTPKEFVEVGGDKPVPKHYMEYVQKNIGNRVPAEGQPEVIIMLGVPASQKSQFISALGKDKTHVQIDADDAKEFIPEYQKDPALAGWVHNESAYMSEDLLLNHALKNNMNIVLPKIGKNANGTMDKLIDLFKKNGYKVTITYNNLSPEESVKRAYKRFVETGRFIDKDYIQKAALTIRPTYDKLKLLADEYVANEVNVPFGTQVSIVERGKGGQYVPSGTGEGDGSRSVFLKDSDQDAGAVPTGKEEQAAAAAAPSKKVSPKGGRKGHRTLSGYVISRGGIDPKKFKSAGYDRKALSEYGMGHLLRRGGKAFDELAEELANEGLIQVPFDRNNTDVLLEALQGKAAYAFGDGDPTRKELEAQAKHWADQERIEKQQRDIDKKLGIDFDVEEIEAEVEKELISLINKAQKEAGKPSVLNIRDVKKVVRENAGITKVSNLIKEEEALERSLQRQAAAAKKAYAEGKKEESLKLRQKWLEDKAKKKLAELTKKYIKDIHAIDTSEMSKINKENIEAIQELVDVAVPTEKTMASLRGTLEYMKDNPEADLPDYVIEDLKRLEMLNRSNMTFDQLESLRTAVKHYAALEKLKQTLRVGQQSRKFEAAKEASISEMKDPKEVQSQIIESTDEVKLKAKKVGQNLADVFGINQDHYDLIIESIAKGGEESETFNILFQQVKDGIRKELETKHNYVDLFRMEQKLRGLDKSVKNMAKWRKEKVRIGNFNLTRGQRVALLCHVRNEKNLTHLLEGGFAFKEDPYTIYKVSEEQLDDLLQSMTPEEKAYADIQTIMSDAIYEDLNGVFQSKNGYDLPKEENYYRIKVARSELGKEQQEESILDELKNRYVRIGLSKGFLNKRRAGAKQALILDDFFRDLNDHIHTAAAYVGLEEPLSNASKLLYDKGWRTEFNRRYGDNVWKQIEKGLRDIAGDFESYSDTENFFNYLKSAATKAIFSMNPSTIAKQVLSWPLAQLYVENKHLFQGLADYLTDREGVINRHKMFSPEFRERIETGGYERDVSDIFRHKATGRLAGEKEDLSDFLLAGNRWMDKQTVAAVMQGCVLQKLEQLEGSGLSPEEKLKQAYEFADYVVNRTLSTSAVEHRSAMSRGSVIDRMMTFATTDTNQQLNMIRRFWRNYQRTKDPKERSKAFKSLMLILAHAGITIPLGNAMIDWTMDTLYRRKEKPKFSAKFFAKNMASQVAGLMYIVRDVVSSFINKADKGTFAGQDITYPSFQILNNVADSAANLYRGMTMHKEKDLLKGVDGLAEILFMLRGLPYRTPKKMITSAVGEITGQPRRSEGQKKSKGGSRFLSGGGGGSSGSGGSRFLR